MPTEKVNVRPAESPRQGHALADTTRTHGWIPVPAEFSHPDASTFVAAPAWPMVALSMGAQQKEQVARPGEEHLLLRAARMFERERPWAQWRPVVD